MYSIDHVASEMQNLRKNLMNSKKRFEISSPQLKRRNKRRVAPKESNTWNDQLNFVISFHKIPRPIETGPLQLSHLDSLIFTNLLTYLLYGFFWSFIHSVQFSLDG